MKIFNEMIVALYKREQINMKYSNAKIRLFSAKIIFCLLIWIWLLSFLGLIGIFFNLFYLIYDIPNSRFFALVLLGGIYLPLNHFTWNLEKVEIYLQNAENVYNLKMAKRLFFTLIILGFIFLISVAKYNQYHSG